MLFKRRRYQPQTHLHAPQLVPHDHSALYRMGCVTKGLALMGLVGLAATFSVGLGKNALAQQRSAPPALPACVEVTTTVRYIIGYDHLVHIHNECEQTATCSVTTSANPTPQKISVAAKSDETVVTFRGSPAREFTAQVSCTLE